MSGGFYNTLAILVLALIYMVPLISFAIKYDLRKQFSFKNFVRVVNGSGLIYLFVFGIMLITVAGGAFIEDPEYSDGKEILLMGIVIGFLVSSICVFLPLLLMFNLIVYITTKKVYGK